jgi:predicted ATPase
MIVRRLRVSNFKSFADVDVRLGRFNVLVGANASGKSNFVSIMKFLKDIADSGLDNAISMHGRADYVRNINIGSEKNLFVELLLDLEDEPASLFAVDAQGVRRPMTVNQLDYSFEIEFYKVKKDYRRVVKESLAAECSLMDTDQDGEAGAVGECEVSFVRDKGHVSYWLGEADGLPVKISDLLPPFFSAEFLERNLSPRQLVLENPFFGVFLPPLPWVLTEFFGDIAIYDFDPKLSKRGTLVTGKAELEPDGSNLALVVNTVLEDKRRRAVLYNLVRDLLPFVEDITVEKLPDKSLLATIKEKYSAQRFLPASVISEGTICVIALIAALYFETKPLVVLEEPERYIHPYLISRVVNMMKDAADTKGKQVLITTHNTQVVKHAGLDNLLLVQRDEEGYSTVSRPAETAQVRTFLENDMGIDELFVDNLLEW